MRSPAQQTFLGATLSLSFSVCVWDLSLSLGYLFALFFGFVFRLVDVRRCEGVRNEAGGIYGGMENGEEEFGFGAMGGIWQVGAGSGCGGYGEFSRWMIEWR